MRKFLSALASVLFVISAIPNDARAQGCMDASSEEGVSVVGFLQPQFEYTLGEHEDYEEVNSFTFNRARVGMIGNIPYDVSYYMFLEMSPFKGGAVSKKERFGYLLDAFVTYNRLDPYLKLSVGQFKSPLSLEWNTSCAGLHTIKRSMVVDRLVAPGRDMGLMLSGKYLVDERPFVSYSFALMNGVGMGLHDTNNGKHILGRVVISPLEFISVGGSFGYGKSKPIVLGAEEDKKTRMALELQIKYSDFLFQGEYIQGKDEGSYTTGGGCGEPIQVHEGSLESSGFFAQAMYMTPWSLQLVLKYESFKPNVDEDEREDVLTFGLNYFINDWSRVQINYLYCSEFPDENPDNDQVLAQFQAKF